MPKFDDYTQKTTPEDTDIALILDKTANVNKKTPFSGIWTWIVNKMTNAVIQNLQTTNKTVIGSINELNSNKPRCIKNSWGTSITIPGIHEGRTYNTHGFVIDGQRTIYIVWVAGAAGSLEANAHRIWQLYEGGEDTLQFSVDPNTGALTVTASETTAIMYIGA